MGTNERLCWRELGCRLPGRSPRSVARTGPLTFVRSFTSDEDLIKRLSQTAQFTGDAASVSNVSWSPDGQYLAAGGEDCRITVWEPGMQQKKHTFDMVKSVLPVQRHQALLQGTILHESRILSRSLFCFYRATPPL